MLGVTAALTVSGRTKTLVVRIYQSAAEARAAAEAGLNHGVQVLVTYLRTIPPGTVAGALDALLADASVLEPDSPSVRPCRSPTPAPVSNTKYGWSFRKSGWSISGNSAVDGTVYVEGPAKISGNPGSLASAEGLMLVHEQVSIKGNPELVGQLLVENATSVDSLVEANTIGGNAEITYNSIRGSSVYEVSGWREVR